LPKPQPKKKKNPQKTAQMWLYVAIAVLIVVTLMQTCGFKLPFGSQPSQQQPSGYIRGRTRIVCLVGITPGNQFNV